MADDRANRLPWPPILAVATLALGIVLQVVLPLGVLPLAAVRIPIGIVLLAFAVSFPVLAIRRFRAVGTPVNPTAPASTLATAGIFRVTRNPMYVGLILGATGLGLVVPLPWLLLLVPLLAFALWHFAIRREEAYLERRFGAEYRDYRARVRRWL